MRLFVAVNFTDDFREEILNVMDEMKEKSMSGSFTRRENLHLTLAFIGEENDLKKVISSLCSVEFTPFDISLSRIGSFSGGLYYIGIDGGAALEKLVNDVRTFLKSGGFSIDEKPFKPHITLVREANMILKDKIAVPEARMSVSEFSLMKSERINGKLTYTKIYTKKSRDERVAK